MDRNKILAMLLNAGQTVDANATDEQLLDLLNKLVAQKPEPKPTPEAPKADATVIELKAALAEMTAQRNADRKERITRAVHALVLEDRIPANAADKWVAAAMANEDILNSLREFPARPPGAAPLTVIETNADVRTVMNRYVEMQKDPRSGMARAQLFAQHSLRILAAAGDNTIAAGVQRQVILQNAVRAFATKLLPVRAFSTVFENIALEGTGIVNVPYYDLETAASTDFVQANGYVIGTTTTDTRAITIDKRKYQSFSFPSSTAARQPFYNTNQILTLKAEKLAADVFADILSAITATNFGDAAKVTDASAFDNADMADIGVVCSNAEWPEEGRAMILKPAYYGALVKDNSDASKFGGTEAIRNGRVPNIAGFDLYQTTAIPANSQALEGMAVFPSAMLVATSPIKPADAVLKGLTAYEIYVDPVTGMALEYRAYGDYQKDVEAHTIEANYGYAKGNAAACKRLTSS